MFILFIIAVCMIAAFVYHLHLLAFVLMALFVFGALRLLLRNILIWNIQHDVLAALAGKPSWIELGVVYDELQKTQPEALKTLGRSGLYEILMRFVRLGLVEQDVSGFIASENYRHTFRLAQTVAAA